MPELPWDRLGELEVGPNGRALTARASARRKQQRATEQSFAAVTVIDAGEQSAPSIEMVLPSGLVLRVQDGFDEVTLRRLLGVVAGC
ncbi:MAG: hypothetical protein AAGI22_24875 [Planctomycetota bacterium]